MVAEPLGELVRPEPELARNRTCRTELDPVQELGGEQQREHHSADHFGTSGAVRERGVAVDLRTGERTPQGASAEVAYEILDARGVGRRIRGTRAGERFQSRAIRSEVLREHVRD